MAHLVWGLLSLFSLGMAQTKVPEATAKHNAIVKPSPELTTVARQLKISGHVELSVAIDASGSVTDVKVESGNPVLTAPCVTAVKKWKFNPFVSDSGQPTKAITTLSFDFKQ